MRYPPGHKAKAREALIRAGSRTLKESGFHGVGVDGLAAAAGVTSGAFYSNFPTKEAMLEAVVDAGVGEPFLSDAESVPVADARALLMDMIDDYISTAHCADPGSGCVMPALSADVSRAQPSVREAYDRKITLLVHRIAELLEGRRSDRERVAWSVVALMVGAVSVSRGMPDDSRSRRAAIDAGRHTAKALIEAALTSSPGRSGGA